MSNTTQPTNALPREKDGALTLDRDTKALMLTALRDGKLSSDAAGILEGKLGVSGRPILMFAKMKEYGE